MLYNAYFLREENMEATSHSHSEAQSFSYHISIWSQITLTCYNVHTHKANSISINNTGNACATHIVAHLHTYCSHGTQQCIFFNTVLEVQNIVYCLYFPSCHNSLMPLDCRDLLYDFMLLSTIQMCLGVLSKK